MGKLKDKLVQRVFGDADMATAGVSRAARGFRTGDRRELMLGLVLSGLAYWKRTRPRKTLVYRQEIKSGSAVLIRNTLPGQPPVEVENPKT